MRRPCMHRTAEYYITKINQLEAESVTVTYANLRHSVH